MLHYQERERYHITMHSNRKLFLSSYFSGALGWVVKLGWFWSCLCRRQLAKVWMTFQTAKEEQMWDVSPASLLAHNAIIENSVVTQLCSSWKAGFFFSSVWREWVYVWLCLCMHVCVWVRLNLKTLGTQWLETHISFPSHAAEALSPIRSSHTRPWKTLSSRSGGPLPHTMIPWVFPPALAPKHLASCVNRTSGSYKRGLCES